MSRKNNIKALLFCILVALAFSLASCHNDPIVINPMVSLNIELQKNKKANEVVSKSEISKFDAEVSIVYEDDTVVHQCIFYEVADSSIYILDNTRRYDMRVMLAKVFHIEVRALIDGEELFGKSGDLIIEEDTETVCVTIELGANGFDFVDLGLPSGILWATCNLGANNPEECGLYFAWGETETKKTFNTWTYTVFENFDTLDALHDAAKVNMGGNWHVPTMAEFEELVTYCTKQWTSINDINGYLLTGPNRNTIFFPASGGIGNDNLENDNVCGIYWLNPIFQDDMSYAWGILFDAEKFKKTSYCRYYGQTIRPTCYRNRR